MVRRAEEDDAFQVHGPLQRLLPSLLPCLRHRAAGDQATHAVRQHCDLLQRHRPMAGQLLQLQGQCQAVVRGVLAGVVAQVYGGVAQTGRQHRAKVHLLRARPGLPLQVVHAQAMHQQQQLARHRVPHTGRQGLPVQRLAIPAQRHRGGQRVVAGGQAVAHHPIQRSEHCLALRAAGCLCVGRGQQGLQPRQHALCTLAQQLRAALHRAVHQPGEAPGLPRLRAVRRTQRAPHGLVHPFGDAHHAHCGLAGQLGGRAQV